MRKKLFFHKVLERRSDMILMMHVFSASKKKRVGPSLSSQKGFSLISVVVAMGIMGLLTTGMMRVMSLLGKTQSTVTYKANAETLRMKIQNLLLDSDICQANFAGTEVEEGDATTGTAPPDIDFPSVVDEYGQAIYEINKKYMDETISLSKVALREFKEDRDDVGNPLGKGRIFAVLEMATVKEVAGPQGLSRTVELTVTIDGSNKIISCVATGGTGGGDPLWKRVEGSSGDIYYDSGQVGVGTNIPRNQLDVVGGNGSLFVQSAIGIGSDPVAGQAIAATGDISVAGKIVGTGLVGSSSEGILFPDNKIVKSAPYQDCNSEVSEAYKVKPKREREEALTCPQEYPNLITGGCYSGSQYLLLRGSYPSKSRENKWRCLYTNSSPTLTRTFEIVLKCCK